MVLPNSYSTILVRSSKRIGKVEKMVEKKESYWNTMELIIFSFLVLESAELAFFQIKKRC